MVLEITAQKRATQNVKLVGKMYTVQVPKTASAIDLVQRSKSLKKMNEKSIGEASATMNSMIDMMFSEKDAEAVRKRLKDHRDLLDLDHISELLKALMEKEGENPTTPSSD